MYLSNAVEKFCKETGFNYSGVWHKWASYGFDKDGILNLEEYLPDLFNAHNRYYTPRRVHFAHVSAERVFHF